MEDEDQIQLAHLSNLAAVEVSFVPRGANGKTFLILKEDAKVKLDEILAKIKLKKEGEINAILKAAAVEGDAADAIKAALRVLSSMGDKVSPELLQQLQALATQADGGDGDDADEADAQTAAAQKAAPPADPAAAAAPGAGAPTEKAAPAAAAAAAPAPGAAPAAGGAAATHAAAAQAHEAAAAAHKHAAAAAGAPGAAPVTKEETTPVTKSADDELSAILKADGTLDEAKLAEVPESVKSVITKLWTAKKEANDALKAAEQKLHEERDARITKEYVAKAEALKNLPGKKDELGVVLKEVALKAPGAYEKIEAVLKSADEMIAKSGITREIGSSAGGEAAPASTGGASAAASLDSDYAKIEQAALVHPVTKGMTKEKATATFVTKTPEGRQMYAAYCAAAQNTK